MSTLCAAINKALNVASKPEATVPYGTAGFRGLPMDLRHVTIRCGMLAVVRSVGTGRRPVGICVTASHNPEEDNGIKIVEPDGGMLIPEYETYATQLVNSTTPFATLETIVSSELKIALSTASEDCFKGARVFVAQDTRPSSPTLAELVRLGVSALGAEVVNVGIATTPMLHWTVATRHDDAEAASRKPQDFAKAYFDFWLAKAKTFAAFQIDCAKPLTLVCDAACGVGGPAMEASKPAFEVFNCQIEVRNRESGPNAKLNDRCGAEHVQKSRMLPLRFGVAHGDKVGQACVALDGDADRVVFFTTPDVEDVPLRTIIDGDRIAVVLSRAILHLLAACIPAGAAQVAPLTFGVVQTAYANGASTDYLKTKLECPAGVIKSVVIAKTGVKNVHHAASEFDVGVYFESNGHGTVTYKRAKLDAWAEAAGIQSSPAFARLLAFLTLINDCVGDAIVDALAMVGAMRLLGLNFGGVLDLYEELVVCQTKVAMPRVDLDKLKSHPVHELFLVEPRAVQERIDAIVRDYPSSRAFVRASGTEDACRIYVEAADLASAAAIQQKLVAVLQSLQ